MNKGIRLPEPLDEREVEKLADNLVNEEVDQLQQVAWDLASGVISPEEAYINTVRWMRNKLEVIEEREALDDGCDYKSSTTAGVA